MSDISPDLVLPGDMVMDISTMVSWVDWALSYDWTTDPHNFYSRPQDLREVWPIVSRFFIARFGQQAADLDQLVGFLDFQRRRTATLLCNGRGVEEEAKLKIRQHEQVFTDFKLQMENNIAVFNALTVEEDDTVEVSDAVKTEDDITNEDPARVVSLSGVDSQDPHVQAVRSRAQTLFGRSPSYIMVEGKDGFKEQRTVTVRASAGRFSAFGKGRRKSNAVQSASRALLFTLRDASPNIQEILNNIPLSNIDQFILNQKLLLELEVQACMTLKKKENVAEGLNEKLEVAALDNPVYGGTLVTLWTTGSVPGDVRAGSNVILKGWEQKLMGIVTSVDEAQVRLSVKENQLVFTLATEFYMERIEGTKEFQKLKLAVENAKNPSSHYRDLCNVLFGLKEPEVLPPDLCPLALFNPNLDRTQRRAVKFVLEQRELAIIHGPPGTGKTTAVVEVILQEVRGGAKVLVCAPSNVAVDNILERLLVHRPEVRGRYVRIGQPARVSEALQGFTLDAVTRERTEEVEELRQKVAAIQADLDAGSDGVTKERQELWKEMEDLRQELQVASQALDSARSEVMAEAEVVLGTLTCCTPDGPLRLLPPDHFSLSVVDECGQALEAACWLVVPRSPRLLLAGDHLQLPPTIHSRSKQVQDQLSVTLMERLLQRYSIWGGKVVMMLDIQYRMNSLIMQWSSDTFYQGKLYASPDVSEHTLAGLPHVTPVVGLTDTVLLLVDTAGCGLEEVCPGDSSSLANVGEARIVCNLARRLFESGLTPAEVGVVTTYAKQVELLQLNLGAEFQGLEIKTVDGFQGREKEVIILSLVRSNTKNNLGFLVEKRRLNVAVTRARRQLIVVCDSATVSADPFLNHFIDYLHRQGSVLEAGGLGVLQDIRVPGAFLNTGRKGRRAMSGGGMS